MPIPEDIVRTRLVFDLGGPGADQDQAVMGFHLLRRHFTGNTVEWQPNVDQIAAGVLSKWVARVGNVALFPQQVILNRVEAYHLNADTGRAMEKGQAIATGANAWRGFGGASLPFETSCAVSLYAYKPGTFSQRPRTLRGRFYLPPFSITQMGDTEDRAGLWKASSQDQCLQLMSAFLNDVQGMHVGPENPSPAPSGTDYMRLVILSKSAGVATQVEQIRVGRTPDSQRRRRRQQEEAYVTGTLTHAE